MKQLRAMIIAAVFFAHATTPSVAEPQNTEADDAYDLVSGIISRELSDAFGKILKELEKVANGQKPGKALSALGIEKADVVRLWLDQLSAAELDIRFRSNKPRAIKHASEVPEILIPSGLAVSQTGGVSAQILAPSRGVRVNYSY